MRVSGRPSIYRSEPITMGRTIQHPLTTIPNRILNAAAYGASTNVKFLSLGIQLQGDKEPIPNTVSLSRSFFARTSIAEIEFSKRIQQSPKTAQRIRDFISQGDLDMVRGDISNVKIIPPFSQLLSVGIPIVDLPVAVEAVPGEYKHYTDYEGYKAIMEAQMIKARRYGERASRICLTRDSLSEEEVFEKLFIDNPVYAARGTFVFGFDTDATYEEVPNRRATEYWFREDFIFGQNATLRFAGLNPMAQAV